MAKQTEASDLSDVVLPLDDPRYTAAYSKWMGLKNRLAQIDDLIIADHDRRAEGRTPARRDQLARALVYGGQVADEPPLADLAGLADERAVVAAAIPIAQRNVEDLLNTISLEVVAKVWPRYRAILGRYREAAAALVAIGLDEGAFIETLVRGQTRLGPMQRVIWQDTDPEALANLDKELAHFDRSMPSVR